MGGSRPISTDRSESCGLSSLVGLWYLLESSKLTPTSLVSEPKSFLSILLTTISAEQRAKSVATQQINYWRAKANQKKQEESHH